MIAKGVTLIVFCACNQIQLNKLCNGLFFLDIQTEPVLFHPKRNYT